MITWLNVKFARNGSIKGFNSPSKCLEKTFSTMDVSFIREKVETVCETNIVICIRK